MEYEQEQLRRLQLAQLDIVREIDRVCREHDIAYFLDSGAALGAVRHGGFIPWDDDIDLGIPRSDYERFLEIAPAALGPEYVVAHPARYPNMAGMFAKVWKRGTRFTTQESKEAGVPQGIFVDVFPYDPLHADEIVAQKQTTKCRLWQSVSYLYHAKTITVPHQGVLGVLERGACFIAHFAVRILFNPQRIGKNFSTWAQKGSELPGNFWLNMSYVTNPFPHEVLAPSAPLEFEGYSFSGPAKVEQYLEILYGSTWKQLPPMKERKNHAPLELDFGD